MTGFLMTKSDVVDITGLHRSDVNKAFVAASQVMPSIRMKTIKCRRRGSRGQADFTLEEVLVASKYLRGGRGLTELEEAMVREVYAPPVSDVALTNPWQGYIKGTDNFVANLDGRTRSCAVCEYCVAKKRGNVYKPFCNLYHMSLQGRSPYTSCCKTFSRSQTAMLFRTNGPPIMRGGTQRKPVLVGFNLALPD